MSPEQLSALNSSRAAILTQPEPLNLSCDARGWRLTLALRPAGCAEPGEPVEPETPAAELRESILESLREAGRPLQSTVLARRCRREANGHFYLTLRGLIESGELERDPREKTYRLPVVADAAPPSVPTPTPAAALRGRIAATLQEAGRPLKAVLIAHKCGQTYDGHLRRTLKQMLDDGELERDPREKTYRPAVDANGRKYSSTAPSAAEAPEPSLPPPPEPAPLPCRARAPDHGPAATQSNREARLAQLEERAAKRQALFPLEA